MIPFYPAPMTSYSIGRPISHRFRDKRRFLSKIANFSHPRVLCAPAEGVSLGIGYRCSGSKNENHGATGPRKKFDDIFSRLDTIHQRDGQTDGRTDTGRQQRPRLRIASRGKQTKELKHDITDKSNKTKVDNIPSQCDSTGF